MCKSCHEPGPCRSDRPPLFSKPDLESVEQIWGNVSPPIKPAVESNEKPASTGEPQAKEPSTSDSMVFLAAMMTSFLHLLPMQEWTNFVKTNPEYILQAAANKEIAELYLKSPHSSLLQAW
ncbi:hypothetical protein BT96DRAFT_946794 [Gymnopus androsaceus JB14]|uniref:Uncharacterized protein n=1 Tax=Gymnopus androsaceus JB14 TaxID=1447944 RepID=A0A6A4GVK2_9AGAR|nr:hypothetical protein BT96DRAFT_946794 [Gymnopus androsaceus JB14]